MRQFITMSFAIWFAVSALAGCRGAQTPQVTHWYGGTAVTTGVYSTPESYQGPSQP